MKRVFTTEGVDPFDTVRWRSVALDDGVTVEAPTGWSDTAVRIVTRKYFRQAVVGDPPGPETSVRQPLHRMAGCWAEFAVLNGLVSSQDQQVYYDEMVWLMLHQVFAPNTPQWFNTGVFWEYGVDKPSRGKWRWEDGKLKETGSRFRYPEPMACYIGAVEDNLTGSDGIFEFLSREARIFQSGAGSGCNFSSLRADGEPLSAGGYSSGMMSFLKVFDSAAGAIKSGGTTRRAAKMVVVDLDHPEIEEFVNWKIEEEEKVAALVAQGYDPDWRGEAYSTVSGQNSNNSVRVPAEFMRKVAEGGDWDLLGRVSGETLRSVPAVELWDRIAAAAWRSADPGVQFSTTINDWHTVPHVGPIEASNPCSEYLSVNDSACNLGSLRLTAFLRTGDRSEPVFDTDRFVAAVKLATLTLEVSVAMAQLPDRKVAENTAKLRNLGLGFADLGGLLMRCAIPYDSDQGRAVAAAVTSLMTAAAYTQSAEMALPNGPYEFYEGKYHSRVLRNHRAAHVGDGYESLDVEPAPIDQGSLPVWAQPMFDTATGLWDGLVYNDSLWAASDQLSGLRNSQVTVIAPTGTIGFVLDADTTGLEPDYALVKLKTLADGSSVRLVNRAVEQALSTLGYPQATVERVVTYVEQHGEVAGCELVDPEHLAVFDCAVSEGRSLSPESHVRMLGAVAPFLSGAASKTINLPHDASEGDIKEMFELAYRLGVKCVSVYRDGCKLSQPLTAASSSTPTGGPSRVARLPEPGEGVSPTEYYEVTGLTRPRFRLPHMRDGKTWEIKVGDAKLFLRSGEYPDGSLGEIFLDIAKEGATLRGVLACFGMAVSHGLQAGIPLADHVQYYTNQMFEPRGLVANHPNVKMATSLVDAVFRVLAVHYEGDDRLAQVKLVSPVDNETPEPEVVSQVTEVSGMMCSCGNRMVRSGTCYTCSVCGETSGGCS